MFVINHRFLFGRPSGLSVGSPSSVCGSQSSTRPTPTRHRPAALRLRPLLSLSQAPTPSLRGRRTKQSQTSGRNRRLFPTALSIRQHATDPLRCACGHSNPCRKPPHRHCEDAGRSSLKQAERDRQIVPLRAVNTPTRQHANTPIRQRANIRNL